MTPDFALAAAAGAGALAGLAVSVFVARKLLSRQAPAVAAAAPAADSAQLTHDVEDLVRQLDLLTQQIEAKVDARLAQLDVAMTRIDEKIAQCDTKAREMQHAAEAMAAEVKQTALHAMVEQEAAGMPIWEPRRSEAAAAEGHNGYVREPEKNEAEAENEEIVTLPGSWPIPEPAPHASTTPLYSSPASEKLCGTRHKEILRLCREGLTADAIAAKLEMNCGEVELVLNLHHAGQKQRS